MTSNFDEQKSARIGQLEELLDDYKKEIAQLKDEIARRSVASPVANKTLPETPSRRGPGLEKTLADQIRRNEELQSSEFHCPLLKSSFLRVDDGRGRVFGADKRAP
jgi:hypothetical protein